MAKRMYASKDSYLIYLVESCEPEFNGSAGWSFYAVVQGNTDKERVQNWLEAVKNMYGVDLSNDLVCHNGRWFTRYPIAITKLPKAVYGIPKELDIQPSFDKHKK